MDEAGSWKEWDLGNYLERLENEARILLEKLQGKAPLKASAKDKRGWGTATGNYSATAGYKILQAIPYVPPDPTSWKIIWSYKSIPKIDMFTWTMAHKSILTSENLRRRGWQGPSRCPLCMTKEETTDHLLLTCPYAKEVWDIVVKLGPDKFTLPFTASDLLSNWVNRSPFSMRQKDLLKTSWMWLPKFVMWKIWMERNNRLFNEKNCNPIQVATKAKALLSEALDSQTKLQNAHTLESNEDQWLKELVPNHQHRLASKSISRARWEVRLEEQDFIKWRSALEKHSLFFDSASKGNPGAAGGGGILLGPSGMLEVSFSWGLGHDSNNMAEALALWQGLRLAATKNIQNLVVFGDSSVIIQALKMRRRPNNLRLGQILKKLTHLLHNFKEVSFYHILRGLNTQANSEANKGAIMSKATLIVNEVETLAPIP